MDGRLLHYAMVRGVYGMPEHRSSLRERGTMRVWDYQWVGGDWGEATQHATSQRHLGATHGCCLTSPKTEDLNKQIKIRIAVSNCIAKIAEG